jgi:hypothetical protein
MVVDHQEEYNSRWAAIKSIAQSELDRRVK